MNISNYEDQQNNGRKSKYDITLNCKNLYCKLFIVLYYEKVYVDRCHSRRIKKDGAKSSSEIGLLFVAEVLMLSLYQLYRTSA